MEAEDHFPKFPDHRDCETLTELVLAHLPQDAGLGSLRRYAGGEHVWEVGDRADSVFFLSEGQVNIHQGDPDDHGIVIRVVAPGEPFGMLCFCTVKGGHRPSTARATTESEVLQVSLEDFLALLRKSREALPALLHTFCRRLAEAERRIEVLSYRGAEDRLGHLLLQLAEDRGKPVAGQDEQKRLEMTHEELAGMTAMNRSHVTVTMGKLRGMGLISYRRGEPIVIDVPKLKAALGV